MKLLFFVKHSVAILINYCMANSLEYAHYYQKYYSGIMGKPSVTEMKVTINLGIPLRYILVG